MERNIKQIVELLNNIYPINKGEAWDHNGLILGSIKQEVSTIIVALDLTSSVLEYAISNNASLIITHHPFLFEENLESEFRKYPYKEEIFSKLINTKIAYFSLHTTFDNSPNGMPYALAYALNLKQNDYSIVAKHGIVCKLPQVENMHQLIHFIKKNLDIEKIDLYSAEERPTIEKVAFLLGAGDIENVIAASKIKNVSVVVTSDVKWSDWITLHEMNIKLLSISHSVENIFVDTVAKLLHEKFDNLKIYKFYNKVSLKSF